METKLINSLTEDLNCSVCLHLFTDARTIPCGHTYCFACLSLLGTSFLCPLCRNVCNIRDINLIPKNYHINSIIEKLSNAQKQELHLLRDDSPEIPFNNRHIYPTDYYIPNKPIYPHSSFTSPSRPPDPIYPTHFTSHIPSNETSSLNEDELILHNAVMMSASAPPVEDLSPIPKPSPIFTISNTVPGSEQNTPKTEVKSPQEDIHYINFKVDSTQIDKCFNFWKKTLWFTPQKFFEMAVIRDISQVLVPHWLFNVDCEVTIKANVLQSIVDPYTYVLKQEWRDIFDQKISHFDNIICLGTPLNEAHYVHLLESVKHWDPSSILQNADESTGWWVTLFRSFMGSEQQKKKSVSEYPLLPFDSWLYCFDRHCRKKVEELEIEQASLFLKKKDTLM